MKRGAKIGGLIAWGVVFLAVLLIAFPYQQGVRTYNITIPQNLSETSTVDKEKLLKTWKGGLAAEVEDVNAFNVLNPQISYLVPERKFRNTLVLHYLGQIKGGPIIHTYTYMNWWRTYSPMNPTISIERSTLEVSLVSDWTSFFLAMLGVGGLGGALVGGAVGGILLIAHDV